MSQSHPRPSHARPAKQGVPGRVLAALALLVVVTAIVAPWAAGRISASPHAPVVGLFVLLWPALYLWFRVGQQAKRGVAVVTALVYAVLAAGLLWTWRGR